MNPHEFIDFHYHPDGDDRLPELLKGRDIDARYGSDQETLLHAAARRRRCSAISILLDHGANINLQSASGKTAYAHAARRKFDDVVELLKSQGADTKLALVDQFAVAVVEGRLEDADEIYQQDRSVVRTGNNEEDRLLADVAGRPNFESVKFLVDRGANLEATALDGGTALHQACWFCQPKNARFLVESGAPLEVFDSVHESSPLGWAVHGSRYSGGADMVQEKYSEMVEMLLAAGANLHYPGSPDSDDYYQRLLKDATSQIRSLLEKARKARPSSS